ncbi:hypothetical protein DPX16_3160 [Anabarilius grahami]|uniref:Uncharacterized protein n=1 Tax=Anabarilius grahami TaxID=495550 RepID=A0A3N0YZM0_ANAGA|nr:hypothetical protein DPX16_3160 [Anabarilius grahami]
MTICRCNTHISASEDHERQRISKKLPTALTRDLRNEGFRRVQLMDTSAPMILCTGKLFDITEWVQEDQSSILPINFKCSTSLRFIEGGEEKGEEEEQQGGGEKGRRKEGEGKGEGREEEKEKEEKEGEGEKGGGTEEEKMEEKEEEKGCIRRMRRRGRKRRREGGGEIRGK